MAAYLMPDGAFEATDWDMSTRVLKGLTGVYETQQGLDGSSQQYPEAQVQHELKTIAVRLYNHQKMTKLFKENVRCYLSLSVPFS